MHSSRQRRKTRVSLRLEGEDTVRDEAAFQRSIEALTKWDFDRIIVGHGEIIATDGKRQLAGALKEAGF